jgi:HAMP domain-containing protein
MFYGRQVESHIRLGINHIDKEDFLSLYRTAHEQAMTKANIQSGFAATGLIPYDPARILDTLSLIVRTPSPALSGTTVSTWVGKTPHTMKDIKRQVQYMNVQPTIEFQQLLKGFETAVHERALAQAEVGALRKANERQVRKRAKRRTIIQKEGNLTVAMGQELVYERELATQLQNERRTRRIVLVDEAPKIRAPRKCSVCESLEHTARTCPVRVY